MDMVAAFLQFPNGKKLSIEKEIVSVGRSEPADLIVDDQSISRAHATLAWEEGTWTVQDLGSRNGTFVDNKQLEAKQKVPLTDGCTVHFGYVQLKFYLAKDVADDATMALDMNDPNVAAMFRSQAPRAIRQTSWRPAESSRASFDKKDVRSTGASLRYQSQEVRYRR
jgi:predicted component of type VI protein secretion system